MGFNLYRIPGHPSLEARNYIDSMKEQGWSQDEIENFKDGILHFENLCLTETFESAVRVFRKPVNEAHWSFLKRLHPHIRLLTKAEYNEFLHYQAVRGDINALALLMGYELVR